MGNQIIYSSTPLTEIFSSEIGKHADFVYAIATVQGWRKKQEDAYKVIADFHEGHSYFAVFDGHGGSEISEFLKNHLHNYIKGFLIEHNDVELALHLGFLSCDTSLRDPDVKAILNAMIDAENDVATRILKTRVQVHAESSGLEVQPLRNRLGASNPPRGSDLSLPRGSDLKPPCGSDLKPSCASVLNPPPAAQLRNTRPSPPMPPGYFCFGIWGPEATYQLYPERRSELHIHTEGSVVGRCPGISAERASGAGSSDAIGGPNDAGPGSSGARDRSIAEREERSGSSLVFPDANPDREFPSGAGPSREFPIAIPVIGTSASVKYLLKDGLESSDSEDADFDVEEECSSSESTDEEMPLDSETILTQEPGDLSGSTATVALLSKNKLFVANVGDSRCVLSRNGVAVDMSLDHTPHNPEELQRIKNAGGLVSADGRVNNLLNLSRAFGDFKLKGPSNIPAEQCITAEPFVKVIDLQKEDDFIVIASDGLWNSFTSQSLIDYLNIRIKAEDSSLTAICEEIFKLIIPPKLSEDGTGCDNITLLIIKLRTNESCFYDDDSECVEMYSSTESEIDCDASTDLHSVSSKEQPFSSEVGSTGIEKPIPTEVDSTSNEADSSSTEKQLAPLPKASIINSEDADLKSVDLDP